MCYAGQHSLKESLLVGIQSERRRQSFVHLHCVVYLQRSAAPVLKLYWNINESGCDSWIGLIDSAITFSAIQLQCFNRRALWQQQQQKTQRGPAVWKRQLSLLMKCCVFNGPSRASSLAASPTGKCKSRGPSYPSEQVNFVYARHH